ncbi:39S ribosomal protein L41 [Schistosoma japonicum]|uniref:39S ribosomal protein L41 n=1 Tax=Schistosoma japonicum TaxID=6182 RepID=Q5DB77_SCHJA|nr:SJCHGC02525 protein [Schistosoma japonicum]TNN09606.1 39S ribosomal protein L41 [Schistosoma japonicum]
MHLTRLIWNLSICPSEFQPIRTISVSMGPLGFRQKIAYKTRYHWMLDLKKSRARAKYPWIPKEPVTSMEIYGQKIEFPEMYLDFIVPSELDKCELKPYVSWHSTTIGEGPLTAEVLFNKRYSRKITEMCKSGASDEEIMEYLKSTNCQ